MFTKGQIVEIAGTSLWYDKEEGEGWLGLTGEVVGHAEEGEEWPENVPLTLVQPHSDRPDIFGTAEFFWATSDLRLVDGQDD